MLSRRELFAAVLGSHVAAMSGCTRSSLPPKGELLAPNISLGHQIRDGYRPAPGDHVAREDVDVVIVGGGIAGLSAAWRLQQSGVQDFVVLEMDQSPGGTSRSGRDGSFAYPWGAHYLPTPMAENQALVRLLSEMDLFEEAVDGAASDAEPGGSGAVVREEFLCRDPQERVFHEGRWHEGLYPIAGADDEDRAQLEAFQRELHRWVARRDSRGRRMFAIPQAQGSSDDAEVVALDQESMATWMQRHRWTSPRLRWLVDYSCRDDYGLSIDQTSAWAGLFYFCSRLKEPDDESQAIITWPEGNGRIVQHLASRCGRRLRTGHGVTEIKQDSEKSFVEVVAMDIATNRPRTFRSKRVIFAAPQFLAPHLIRGVSQRRRTEAKSFRYGSWLVANVHLRERPRENGFPMCWDNVIYNSKSLGYVASTHQTGSDHGPTVLTWYYPFSGVDPIVSHQQLLALKWSDWADLVLTDLQVPHPDIRDLVTRLDVMRWGHAMIQPRVGFVFSRARRNASKPDGAIHFAGTDLSGIALMEEAFYHGVRAAEEVLRGCGVTSSSILSPWNGDA